MVAWIERDRARAFLRIERRGDVEVIGVALVHDGQRTVAAVRAVRIAERGVERGTVGSAADRHGRDVMSRFRIGDRHVAVLANREKALVRGVEREAARLLAVVELPRRTYAMGGDVDSDHRRMI